MISLDTNLSISPSFQYLLLKLRKKYGYNTQSIDKNAEAQTAQGAQQTQNAEKTDKINDVNHLEAKKNLDFDQLIEDLKLNLPENRFAILMMMPSSELFEMLQLLGKDKLINGLKFFSKEKLMSFIGHLPKKQLLKMLFHLFTDRKQLVDNLPTKELHRFLSSDKIEKGHLMNTFEMLPRNTLAKLAESITGQPCDKMSKSQLLNKIKPFEKYQLTNGIKKLDEKTMRNCITLMLESNPELYNEFSHSSLYKVSERFARVDLAEAMTVVDDDKVLNMLGELPDKLLALTVSQIDPEIFADILLNDYQDLLANLVLG